MKIGIITIHHSCNYGACLQSFALYKYLELLGYTVEIIDLHRPFHDDYVVSKRFHAYLYREETFKQFLKRKIKTLFAIVKNGGSKVSVNTKTAVDLFNASALRKFDDFNAQIKLSCPFRSIDELYNNPPQYDIYILREVIKYGILHKIIVSNHISYLLSDRGNESLMLPVSALKT